MTRHCLAASVIWVVLLALPIQARADRIPTDADCYTEAKFNADCLAHRLRRLEAYDRCTDDPASVRAKAKDFLFAYERFSFRAPDALTKPEVARLGRTALDAGSADPLVAFYVVLAEAPERTDRRFEETLWKHYDALAASRYPKLIWFDPFRLCALEWTSFTPRKADETREMIERFAQAWINDPDAVAGDQRYRWMWVKPALTHMDCLHMSYFRETIEKFNEADPWLINMVAATFYKAVAHYHGEHKMTVTRRGGIVSPNIPHDPRLFEENRLLAEQYFRNAWLIGPEQPEAAAELITLSTTSKWLEPPRTWFDRAVASQMDYQPAYREYTLVVLQAESHYEVTLNFARECLATGRFDTEVPYQFVKLLGRFFAHEEKRPEGILKRSQNWPDVERVYRKMLTFESRPFQSISTFQLRSEWMMLNLCAGYYDEALKQYEMLEKQSLNDQSLTKFWLTDVTVNGLLHALRGPASEPASQVAPLFVKNKRIPAQERAACLEAIEKTLDADSDEHVQRLFGRWKKTIEWEEQYDAGDWVTLTFNPKLDGWFEVGFMLDGPFEPRGGWQSRDDTSVDAPTKRDGRLELLCNARFPGAFEIEGQVTVVGGKKKSATPAIVVLQDGFNTEPAVNGVACWASPAEGRAGFGQILGAEHGEKAKLEQDGPNTIRVQCLPDKSILFINDRQIATKKASKVPFDRIAVGLLGPPHRTDVRFSQLRVRKLTLER